jgi:hypothetical protein
VLLLAALALLIAAVLFDWNPWPAGATGMTWPRQRIQAAHLQTPPAAVTLLGALFTIFTSGLILLFVFPARLAVMARSFHRPLARLARLALLGLLAALLTSVAALSASLTMITFALTLFLGIVLSLSILFGSVALAYRLGRFLLDRAAIPASPIWMLLVGEVLLFALVNLPAIGTLAFVFIAALGLGAAISTHFGSGRPWSLITLTEEG